MKLKLVAFLALVVVASGCLGSSQTPEQKLESLTSKANSSTYHITYAAELGGSEALSGLIGSPEIYSLNGDTKHLTTTNLLGSETTSATYKKNGMTVRCTDSALGLSEGISCSKSSSSTTASRPSEMLENVPKIAVNETGTRTIAGRECSNFELRASENTTTYTEDVNGTMNLCVDNQKGYIASMGINITTSTELNTERTRNALRMYVKEYDDEVSPEDLEIPVNTLVSLSCDPFHANITSLGYTGEAQVELAGNNQTVNLEEGEERRLDFKTSKRSNYNTKVTVYAGGKASSDSCTNVGGFLNQ
ncbi:MAG: hypothetical protein H8Z69_02715 [Nanohaloarchaea archaeon]|nr:hypothetical protein [Candidatus Nanohaloarchaea archaeon]